MPRELGFFVGAKDQGESRHTPRGHDPITRAIKREPFLCVSVSALALVALLTPVSSFAQDAEADPEVRDASSEVEPGPDGVTSGSEIEIVVTGSRLTTGFSAPTPVTVIGAEAIQQRAQANLADVLNEAPQFRASQTDATRGATTSTRGSQNTLNLRNLDDFRTLVLINGRRTVGSNFLGTFDTNMIPAGLIERVEVVTGGASAAYGSDAVAGVVNVILRNQMQGLEASLQHGITDYGDGQNVTATLAGGTAFAGGRGNIVLGADYSKSKGVDSLYERPWGQQEISTVSRANRPADEPARVITTGVEPGTTAPGGLIQTRLADGNLYAFDAAGNPYVFDQGTLYGSNMVGSTANYGYNQNANGRPDLAPIQSPTERATVYARAQYELTDSVTAFVEANYARTELEPSLNDLFYTGGEPITPALRISGDNPFIPDSIRALLTPEQQVSGFTLGRINTEMPRTTEQSNELKRGVVGLEGYLGGDWRWEASYQEGRFTQNLATTGFVPAALQKAVQSCSAVGLTAAELTQVNTYESLSGKACVPFNPFGVGLNSAEAINYITNDQVQDLDARLRSAEASISGSPFALWAGDLAVAAGVEYREESLSIVPDELVSSATTFYSLGHVQPYGGKTNVKEGFLEVGLPLLRDLPFAQSVDLNGAVRRTDYSYSGPVATWKVGGTWEVFDQFRLRITRSRDIRAPNLTELYYVGPAALVPVTNTIPIGTVGKDGTINTKTGTNGSVLGNATGNTNMDPEIANTFTVGGVLTLGRFRASLDYYKIRVDGAIAQGTQAGAISDCALGSAEACSRITFDNSALGIAYVTGQYSNGNTLKVQGWDMEAQYSWPRPFGLSGDFQVRALVNHTPHYQNFNVANDTVTEQAGTFTTPEWQGTVNFSYTTDRLTLGLQVRSFSDVRENAVSYDASGNITSTTVLGPEDEGYDPTSSTSISKNHYPGRTYLNPSVQFRATDGITLFANVDNLLNTAPPALTLNTRYDLIGRRYRVGIRATVF